MIVCGATARDVFASFPQTNVHVRSVAHPLGLGLGQKGDHEALLFPEMLTYDLFGQKIVIECLHDFTILDDHFKLAKTALLVNGLNLDACVEELLVNLVEIVDVVD